MDDIKQEQIKQACVYSRTEKTKLPDYKNYINFGIMIVTVYNHEWKKNEQLTIVKIIRNIDGNIFIIKFLKPRQINYGWGPTIPSIYALIDINDKIIEPIYLSHIYLEEKLIDEDYIPRQ